jgi:SAM-dependent methyltransferase
MAANAVSGAALAVRRLNLGCGHDVRTGWVNLDSAALPGVDVVHDLAELPLPFDGERFDEIECKDILEHVELTPVLRELHRILVPGGRLHVQSPHFTSAAFHIDPTHRRAFSIETLSFYVAGSQWRRDYYFDFHFARIERARITFHCTRGQPWNGFVERWVNRSPRRQGYYEATFLSRLLPALNVQVTLVK